MKKVYLTLTLAATVAAGASAQTKFDASSLAAVNFYKQIKQNPAAEKASPLVLPFDMETYSRSGVAETGLIVKLAPGASFEDIEAAGLYIVQKVGDDMCVASASMDDVILLDNVDAVQSVSLSQPLSLHLDKARAASGVAEVHAGTATTGAYTGKGVLCGIFDAGVDPNHINFYDKDFKETRVKAVYRYVSQNGSATSYTTPEAIKAFTTDNSKETHGTHTLGCMAGGFRLKGNKTPSANYPQGSPAIDNGSSIARVNPLDENPYYGTAPDADLHVHCGTLTDANVIAAVGKIVDYAVANNQPAVVNLSLGRNSGSHDGTDNFGQAMDRYSKNAIICVSSGNEGDLDISIVKTLTASDNQLKTMIAHNAGQSTGIIDIFADKNKFNFSVVVVDKTNGQILVKKDFNTEGSFTLSTSNYTTSGHIHDANFDKAFSSSYVISTVSDNASTSGRHSINVQYSLTRNAQSNASGNYLVGLICEGTSGQRIDVVNSVVSGSGTLSSGGLAGWSNGTPDFSINTLACSPNVIAVGSWTSRVTWPTMDRAIYYYSDSSFKNSLNGVSPFTSYGVLADGRALPLVCAPGCGIVSSYNSYYSVEANSVNNKNGTYDTGQDAARYKFNNTNYVWQREQGTSMASPFAAGIIATWLEADPTLTVKRVQEIIKKTSDPLDATVKSGAGKINAFAGLKEVLSTGAVNDVKVDDQILIRADGNQYELFVPGGSVSATVYNINGQPVRTQATPDNTLNLDLSSLAKGIYLLNVNGAKTERIAIR